MLRDDDEDDGDDDNDDEEVAVHQKYYSKSAYRDSYYRWNTCSMTDSIDVGQCSLYPLVFLSVPHSDPFRHDRSNSAPCLVFQARLSVLVWHCHRQPFLIAPEFR